ncbi:MAG TPA: histidine phosphatase family protein [Pseudomonadales bacterium]
MKNVYVVTHPESVHHLEGRVGGWYDTGLTERGREHARRLAARLVRELDGRRPRLVSSDLERARQTAEIIADELACPVDLTADLRELSYGVAEGRPQSWLDERFVPAPDHDRLDHRSIEGGETKREFVTRVYRAVDRIVESPVTDHVIVTHGFALTFVIARWIGLRADDAGYVNFRSSSGGLTHLQEDDYFRNRAVRFLNDTRHLEADAAAG